MNLLKPLKFLFKKWLIQLLSEDYQVQIQLTRIANPDLAHKIENHKAKHPPPPPWWRKPNHHI